MNLIEYYIPSKIVKIENENIISFEDFRQEQYNQLEWFANLCVDYISNVGGKYLQRSNTVIENEIKYEDIFGYSLTRVQVKIKHQNSEKVFLNFIVPTLIDGNFFYLNGSHYSPTCYILDKPISIKKKSFKLFGVFNPITVFTKDKRVIFGGHNIPINYFLQLLVTDQTKLIKFTTFFKIPYNKVKDSDLESYFSGIFHCNQNLNDIRNIIETLFLDDYTKMLYQQCYNLTNANLSDILLLAIDMSMSEEKPSFVDLNHKRLVFMEQILRPIFQKTADFAQRVNKGFKADEMHFSQDEVLKYFTTKLKNKFLYDVGNLFSAIATHKVSFVNPGSDNAPSEISSAHESQKGRICQISISAQDPGATVSVVPQLPINKLGLFI